MPDFLSREFLKYINYFIFPFLVPNIGIFSNPIFLWKLSICDKSMKWDIPDTPVKIRLYFLVLDFLGEIVLSAPNPSFGEK